jgi:hypothetical protein
VLDDDHRARRREATFWASTGHAAAIHGDELYDALPQTRGGYGRLQDVGIHFGYEGVVLHVDPQVHTGRLECNTARTLLLLDHEPQPRARWGEEFTAAMPDDIRRLQEHAANADGMPRREAIRGRISAIMPLYRLSRYRPTRSPRHPSTGSGVNGVRDGPVGLTSTGIQAHGTPPAANSMPALAAAAARDDWGASHRQPTPMARRALTRLRICPTSRVSPRATARERRVISRTRQPATTRAATS